MKITLGKLFVADDSGALVRLYQSRTPARIGFVVKGLIKEVTEELSKYRVERLQTFQKYGTEVQPGKWEFPAEQIEALKTEMDELNALEVELKFEPISINALGDASLSGEDLTYLEPFIVG
jgi:hypothetical protein